MPNDAPEPPIIAAIRDLCARLGAAPLAAADLAAQIGEVAAAGGGSLRVRPHDPSFREARIVLRTGGDEPAHLDLTLADPAALHLSELRAAFGPAHPLPRTRPGAPRRASLAADPSDTPYTCTIIATLQALGDSADDAAVPALTLRRDLRLAE